MTEHKVKLNWTPKGYQPEGYEWWNYRPSSCSYTLRHDLFEHQAGESGTDWEELRAFGARLRFEKNHKVGNFLFRFRNLIDKFSYPADYNKTVNQGLLDIVKTDSDINFVTFEDLYWLSVLNEGYVYALNFSKKAWVSTLCINFEILHAQEKNITIDLNIGKVVS